MDQVHYTGIGYCIFTWKNADCQTLRCKKLTCSYRWWASHPVLPCQPCSARGQRGQRNEKTLQTSGTTLHCRWPERMRTLAGTKSSKVDLCSAAYWNMNRVFSASVACEHHYVGMAHQNSSSDNRKCLWAAKFWTLDLTDWVGSTMKRSI
jgi:hypothetical protein